VKRGWQRWLSPFGFALWLAGGGLEFIGHVRSAAFAGTTALLICTSLSDRWRKQQDPQ
jgi:hypothetical protein